MYNEGGMTDTAGEECFEMVQDGPGRPKRRKKKKCKQTFGKRGIPDVVKKIAKGAVTAGGVIAGVVNKEKIKKMLGINQVGGSTKATYKEGGSAKPKCPMGMSYDFSLKKCVKPGTTDTPLDKLKKEKARMLKTNFKTGGMVNANAKLVATKSAGSKGVKVKVNPKAAASNVAKKPSASRSKAPKKATPGRK